MSISSKIKTLLWFISKPKYYSQLLRLIKTRLISSGKEDTRTVAESWCAAKAMSTKDVLRKFNADSNPNIENKYESTFQSAYEIVSKLPVKMGGGGDMNLLYFLSESIEAREVIETGVAHGWSSLSILLSISKRKGGKLVSTDMPYAKMGNESFVGCVVPENLKENWTLIRLADESGLPKALNEFDEIDLCHYDSDKTYKGRKWAYPKLWNKLRSGGLFISDDIGDNIAFKEFTESLQIEPTIVKFKSQFIGVIKKP